MEKTNGGSTARPKAMVLHWRPIEFLPLGLVSIWLLVFLMMVLAMAAEDDDLIASAMKSCEWTGLIHMLPLGCVSGNQDLLSKPR